MNNGTKVGRHDGKHVAKSGKVVAKITCCVCFVSKMPHICYAIKINTMCRPRYPLLITAVLFWWGVACGNRTATQQDTALATDTINLSYTVEEAPEWSRLFDRTSGWFGADGIFSIPLHGVDNPQST